MDVPGTSKNQGAVEMKMSSKKRKQEAESNIQGAVEITLSSKKRKQVAESNIQGAVEITLSSKKRKQEAESNIQGAVEITLSSKKKKQKAEPKNQAAVAKKMSTPRRLNAKTSSDKSDCWIHGLAFSPPNQLFAADANNESIKMININSGDIKELKLHSAPRDVTIVTKDTIAVTLPDRKRISFISFSQGILKQQLKKTLKVGEKCCGISHHQRKLAVTFIEPAKLQIMDLKGKNKITVGKDSDDDNNLFVFPTYVTTNRHSIYTSDRDSNLVLRYNWQGEFLAYEVLSNPKGITLLRDGSLLVNDFANQCVHRLTGDLEESKTTSILETSILEDEDSPQAACWCAKTKTLCVSTFNEDSGDNFIKLYKI